MIFHGPRLLINPTRAWPGTVGDRPRPSTWLIAAALTAAVWPGVAVVGGHIGSAALGYEESAVATLRAAIGFMSVVGGALVMAPALTLILLWLTDAAHEDTTPDYTGPVAMGVLWPVWTAGLVLAVPPLLGLGPELGEAAWIMLAAFVTARTLRHGAVSALAIRRRWKSRFLVHSTAAFLVAFMIVSIAPAVVVRSILGAATPIEISLPDRPTLPLPPEPNW
ncbi:MAG: hypothetical protein GY854_04105 [Deltaproteobacteria bacterium]|nr:hypothetical protein [Deltaproteobacteria bacterium]